MDGCSGKGSPEVCPVSDLTQGHERVRHGGADVRAHHHRNGLSRYDEKQEHNQSELQVLK